MESGAQSPCLQSKVADSFQVPDGQDEVLQPASLDAMRLLISTTDSLRCWEGGQIDVVTLAGMGAATAFLRSVHRACGMLEVRRQQKSHLDGLSERAASRWMDPQCPYSVHVWARSMDGVVCLNKKEYPLSRKLKFLAAWLERTLMDIIRLLRPLRATPAESWRASGKAQMQLALAAFDRGWAPLEAQFLAELTTIEVEARSLALKASEHLHRMNRVLESFESSEADELDVLKDKDFLLHRDSLVDCVSRLNLAANPRCSGRKFAAETLQRAEEIQEISRLHPEQPESGILAIATEATNSFYALCDYFLGTDVDELDPNLSNNRDLVELLVAWEASWELAAAYVDDELGLHSLCDLVMYVREAKAAVPALAQMCEEVSPELFVVVPRIVWLKFLHSPSQIGPLIRTLLPHRFSELPGEAEPALWYDEELLAFMENFRHVWNSLAAAAHAGVEPQSVDEHVSSTLVRGAVLGWDATLDGSSGGEREAYASFVRAFEGWSMELQRHRAQEWNRFIAAVLRCVSMEAAEAEADGSDVEGTTGAD